MQSVANLIFIPKLGSLSNQLRCHMIKMKTLSQVAVLLWMCTGFACKKGTEGGGGGGGNNPPVVNNDTVGTLKDAADFPIGIGVDYTPMKNNASYLGVVKRDFDNVTFGYQMKHGAIVKDDGALDFTSADDLYNICNTNGLAVYGHTLCWYQNNN